MFDAGAIMARLDIDTSAAKRSLDDIEARVEALERQPHEVKIIAKFDTSELSRDRQIVANFDNQISRDAAQRLRSGGNGSVLGALNALFNKQAAGAAGGGTSSSGGGGLTRLFGGGGRGGGGNFLGGILGGLLGGRATGVAAGEAEKTLEKEQAKADEAVKASLLRRFGPVALAGIGQFGGLGGGFGGNLAGGIGPGILGLSMRNAGILGIGGGLLGAVPGLLAPLAGLGVGVAGVGAGAMILKQALSQSNISQYVQQYQAGQNALQAATTPQQRKAAEQQMATAMQGAKAQGGAGFSAFNALNSLHNSWQSFTAGFLPTAAKILGSVASLFKSLEPELQTFFGGAVKLLTPFLAGIGDLAKMILPELGQAFKVAGPLLRPLLDGFGMLVKGLFPGLIKMLSDAMPAVRVFAQILGTLGHDIGSMFGIMAPVLRSSSIILKALMDLIGAIFPILGHLIAIFAKALAPAFAAFASAISSILPFIKLFGTVVGELAGAILGDLASAFGAVASLIKGISPALQLLAKALGQVFRLLENSGVFAVLGNALEAATKPLAALISAIVRGLVPFLPVVTKLIGSLANDAVALLVQAIKILVPIAIQLVNEALKPLLPVVRVLEPIIAAVAKALGQGLGVTLRILAPILAKLAPYLLAAAAAMKIFAIAMGIVNVVTDANPIGLIAIAVAGLIVGITLLVTHWKAVWTDIKHWAEDAWNFIYNGWGKYLLVFLGPFGLLALGAIELAKHWSEIWNDIKHWAEDAWNFITHGWGQWLIPGFTLIRDGVDYLANHWTQIWAAIKQTAADFYQWFWSDFGQKIENFVVHTIPSWWDEAVNLFNSRFVQPLQTALSDLWQWVWTDFGQKIFNFFTQQIPNQVSKGVSVLGQAWTDVESAIKIPVNWVITNVINNGLIAAFDWISSKVGGPHIDPIRTFARGGRIMQGTTGTADDVLARVSKGETIVPAHMSGLLAPLFSVLGIPGYAQGGVIGKQRATDRIGTDSSVVSKFGDIGKIILAIFTGNGTALTNAILNLFGISSGGAIGDLAQLLVDIPKTLVSDVAHFLLSSSAHIANGNSIVKYAESFIGKVPYVWGGTTPKGWDCSGFVEWVYDHFGYSPPRTSFAQWDWVKRTTMPVAGGLVFMAGADGTVSNPGHVGIVISPTQMANAFGTGFGTINSPIVGSGGGITGYGIPPTGIGGGGPGTTISSHDRGGWLTGLGINQLTRPEAVLTPRQSEAFVSMAQAAEAFSKMGGGSLMGDVHIMLPEGGTVADAMHEIDFQLRVAQQRGFSGVIP